MTPDFAQLVETMGLPSLLALAFGGGVLLSFTPCVYPMIPVTVAAFGARNVSRPRALALSLAYVLGIASMYSLLGVWAATTGRLFGALLADPRVTGVFGALFALLASISFGWFPAIESWFSRTPSRVIRLGGASPGGAYVMGLGAGVVFAPCVGPIVVGILAYVATTGDIVLGAALLGSAGLGMGLLFVLIAVLANEGARLPRAPGLLVGSRFVLGLLLLAAATYYLRLSVPRAWANVLPTVALGFGVLSAWRMAAASSRVRWAVIGLGMAALVIGATYLRPGEEQPSVVWRSDLEAALADARRTQRFTVLDFTADWCLVCHELDARTFRHPDVAALLEKTVRIRVDATDVDEGMDSIFSRFGVLGLPNVVLIDPRGEIVENARVVSFVPPEDYVRILRRAGLDS
ncbi:MAG: protein-disulfide reductase DsbD family protein [Planctomycetota bacterium]